MAKSLEQRFTQLEKLITDFFTGGSKNARKPARRKAKKSKTTKKAAKRKSTRG